MCSIDQAQACLHKWTEKLFDIISRTLLRYNSYVMVTRFLVCFVFAVAIASVECNLEGMEIIYTFVSDFLQINCVDSPIFEMGNFYEAISGKSCCLITKINN